MKKFVFFSLAVLFLAACGNGVQMQNQDQAAASPAPAAQKPGSELSVVSHSTENQFPPSKTPESGSANSASGGSPMARAIDVTAMTEAIAKAEKAYKKAPKNEQVKMALADAYFDRALALTDAAQYRAALGDFRKGLKLNPNDEEAKNMHDQIISIFKSIGREPPREGEEPAPMPIK
jgi:TolA-binding protein